MTDEGVPTPAGHGRALLEEGRRSVQATAAALAALPDQLDDGFVDVVQLLLDCRGHIVVSGAGTSSTLAQRLAHLLTVVGAPAFYLSAGDSTHGGAGAVKPDDVMIAISKGGESDELNGLVAVACSKGVPIVALTQSAGGTLGQQATHRLVFTVPDAIDAAGMIALGSSLAAGAIGDALCFAIFQVRGFDEEQLLQIHPGGAVGKALGATAS